MSGGMDDVPLSDATERQLNVFQRGQSADLYDAQVRTAPTRGNSRAVNKFAMISILLSRAILVAFTVYIIVLCFLKPYSLFLWHPALSTIGGFLLMAEAIVCISPESPITGKFGRSSRVKMHWILQTVGSIFLLIGFLVIVINKNWNNKLHFQTYHAVFGLVAVVMRGITYCNGVTALYSIQLKKFVRPTIMKLFHVTAGILTVVFSAVALVFSLYSHWIISHEYYSTTVKYICFVLIVISSLITLQNATRVSFLRIMQMCQRH